MCLGPVKQLGRFSRQATGRAGAALGSFETFTALLFGRCLEKRPRSSFHPRTVLVPKNGFQMNTRRLRSYPRERLRPTLQSTRLLQVTVFGSVSFACLTVPNRGGPWSFPGPPTLKLRTRDVCFCSPITPILKLASEKREMSQIEVRHLYPRTHE